jgi:hypothetical protein
MMTAAMLVGATSCDKEAGNDGSESLGTGMLKVTLDFAKPSSNAATYAPTASTAKPSTTWQGNIKSLAIFFTDNTGVIKSAQTIPYDLNNDLLAQTKTVQGVPVGTYDVYVFANWDQGDYDWSVAAAKGRQIKDLYMRALTNGDYAGYKHQTSEANSNGYKEAPEVFVAKHSNITIAADQTVTDSTPYQLTRIVSLVRVRIDQSQDNANNHNDLINFQDVNASLRIRRINTGINLLYTDATRTTTTNRTETDAKNAVFFAKGAFKNSEPTGGYSTGTVLTDQFKSWNDVILFPAGSATVGAEKLDVVVTGITTADYVPAGYPKTIGGVLVEKAPAGSQIAWAGAVTAELTGNGILELNLTLLSAGQWVDPTNPDKPLPEPQEYGNLEIKVGLVEWGAIQQVNIEL